MPGPRLSHPSTWSWHGLAGVILAFSIGIGWAAALVITAVKNGPITDQGANILNTIGGGLVGAVATWIGLAGGKKPDDPDVNNETTTTKTTTTVEPAVPQEDS